MSDLLTTLKARGLHHDSTPGLADRLAQGPITGYIGFDPTAPSLHVGSLLPIMALAWLQRSGGTPVALVGGGTGMIGDPSGKRSERPVLSIDEIQANAAGIREQLSRFLDFSGPRGARLLNNADWLRPLSVLEFLRDVGKHFSINYMLQKESVQSRMETGISYTEFSYMLLQAYDFAHLYRTANCELQMGGSDQWGNITAGIELIGRRERGTAHGLVLPLLTTASGAKFGKSEAGNVWLDAELTSPYRFYQFWFNSDDHDVERLLRFFTFLDLPEIEAIVVAHRDKPEERQAQRRLAEYVTKQLHGAATTERVIAASRILFGAGDIREADAATMTMVAAETPNWTPAPGAIGSGIPLVDALVQVGLAASKSEARRGIAQQGFAVNGVKANTADQVLTTSDLLAGGIILLQKGKRHFAAIRCG